MVQRLLTNSRFPKYKSKLLEIFLVLTIVTLFLLLQNIGNRLFARVIKQAKQEIYVETKPNDTKFDDQSSESLRLTIDAENRNKNRLHVLLVAAWRTGSSFTGNILKSHCLTFYHYEPLLFYQQNLSYETSFAVNHLKHLFHCNYTNMKPYYLDYAINKTWMWAFNRQIWPFCKPFPIMCLNEKFLSATCKIFPVQIIKTVRLTLNATEALLDDPYLNMKIILLVRDPRGIYNSRLNQKWCKEGMDCINLNLLCSRMMDDYEAAKVIKEKFPNKFIVLRYEDLINEPAKKVEELFKFLNLSLTSEVTDFLKHNTVSQIPSSNLAAMLQRRSVLGSRWITQMEMRNIEEVQDNCKNVMEIYRYRPMNDWREKHVAFDTIADDFNFN